MAEKTKKLNIRCMIAQISFWGFILLLPVFYHFFGPSLDAENYENRNMTEKPVLTAETLSTYPMLYEAYYNDNFPFRNKLITFNSRLSYQVFNEGLGCTIVGDEGWLFYNADILMDGRCIEQYKGIADFTEEELKQAAESLEATKNWCEEHDCEFVLMICPNKERMYAEYMPSYYRNNRLVNTCNTDQLVDYLRENTDIRLVWAYEDLLEYKKSHPDDPVYLHLDTHWNNLGGYIGARALLAELGIDTPAPDDMEKEKVETYSGDLTYLMNLGGSDLFTDTNYKFAGYPAEDMEIISDNVNSTVSYRCPGHDPRNVVIYRDSFCNNMRYFIGEHFNFVNMVPKEEWDAQTLEDYTPDVLVYEMNERFVDRLLTEHIQP